MSTTFTLDQEQVDMIKDTFEQFDTNGYGHIDHSEIGNMLELLGKPVNQQEINKMLNESDFDQDGKISFDEFLKVASQQIFNSSVEDDDQLFANLDSDNDGLITLQEFSKYFSSLGNSGPDEAKKQFERFDKDKDGKITKEEFLAAIN